MNVMMTYLCRKDWEEQWEDQLIHAFQTTDHSFDDVDDFIHDAWENRLENETEDALTTRELNDEY